MPKVSVILPNYNHSQFLTQRIESILNQTFRDFELIILDDCSPDNSKEVIEGYRKHPLISQIVFNSQNSGSTFKQWEKGINLAKGEYIWLAESDDYCESTFLSELVTKLDEYPNVGIAYCQSRSVDQNDLPLESWIKQTSIFSPNYWENSFLVKGKDAIVNFLIYRNIIPNASAVLFRKSAYESTYGLDTSMKLNGDWLLWIRMLEVSDLAFISTELNFFRQHTNKVTSRNICNFNNISESFSILTYLDQSKMISQKGKQQQINLLFTLWAYQFAKSGVKQSLGSFSKVYSKAILVDKLAGCHLAKSLIQVGLTFITRRKSKSEDLLICDPNLVCLL